MLKFSALYQRFRSLEHLNFEFVSNFDIRASDLFSLSNFIHFMQIAIFILLTFLSSPCSASIGDAFVDSFSSADLSAISPLIDLGAEPQPGEKMDLEEVWDEMIREWYLSGPLGTRTGIKIGRLLQVYVQTVGGGSYLQPKTYEKYRPLTDRLLVGR